MAQKKQDGVIEAVHYGPDGKIEWVRAYLRRGNIWSDRILLKRQELIDQIKAGKKFILGQREMFLAGTFDTSTPVQLAGREGSEFLVTSPSGADADRLEGAPVL